MNKYLDWKSYFRKLFHLMKGIGESIEKRNRKRYWLNHVDSLLGSLENDGITDEQKHEICEFYKPYFAVDTRVHEFYYKSTGDFDKRYIPNYIYYTRIDPYFNDWDEAKFLDNKVYYEFIFHDVKQPRLIASRSAGIWTDGSEKIINLEKVLYYVNRAGGCFIKKATESEGGSGVHYIGSENIDSLTSLIESIKGDVVIQSAIKQCATLNNLNSSSVNTIRILSLLSEEGVKIYSSILRMGINDSKVDNASNGGIICGINDDGWLNSVAYSLKGDRYERHPSSGIAFDTVQIPNFNMVRSLVVKIHPRIRHFRLVSWDIALDEGNTPILIEANMYYGGVDCHQLSNGPVFGEDTEKILREIFVTMENSGSL